MVSLAQLKAIGFSPDAVKHRIRCSRLHPVHRGVYAVGHRGLTLEGRWLAAVFACGPGAVLSHRSAAALWEIRPSASPAVDVTVPTRSGRGRRPGIRIHRTARLREDEVTVHEGIPVTTVARTILDLPKNARPKAIEDAEGHKLFDLTSLQAVVVANPGRKGIDLNTEPAFVRSDLERDFLKLCRKHRLPKPRVNTVVGPYEADFLWPDQRLIAETDGREAHATHAAFERDRARDAELTAAGYRVVRFTYRQVRREPDRIAALLKRLL